MLNLQAQYEPLLPDIRAAMDTVLKENNYIMGHQVKELEEKMASYLGARYAVGCASGTDALVLAVQALGIGPGDEVITTPFTFFATASSIWRNGAKPRFADIDPHTFNLDPDQIEAAITPRTKAIMPVHLFGQCCDMERIMKIARKHGLKVIEDNAQGIGCTWNGKMSCTFGDIGTLSFFPSKNLGAMGDGGMCVTDGENPKYYHQWVGLNSRLDTLQAAILNVKLDHLAGWSEARRANAAYYNEKLAGIPQVKIPYIAEKAVTIYNQYTLICAERDALLEHLKDRDIGCAVYYPKPLHLQECFAELGYKEGDLPVAEQTARQVLSIPIYPELTEAQKRYVFDAIRDFYRGMDQ
jgi:dTDP-4-amino-4,6-dideoxygalactose transaminase